MKTMQTEHVTVDNIPSIYVETYALEYVFKQLHIQLAVRGQFNQNYKIDILSDMIICFTTSRNIWFLKIQTI